MTYIKYINYITYNSKNTKLIKEVTTLPNDITKTIFSFIWFCPECTRASIGVPLKLCHKCYRDFHPICFHCFSNYVYEGLYCIFSPRHLFLDII